MPLSIAQRVLKLQNIRDGYLTDLENDALTGTQPDYNLDGQTVNRDAWREGLEKKIDAIDFLLNRLQPYSLKSVSG